MTTISEIEIMPIKPNKGLVSFVSFVVDEKFYFSIHTKLEGGYRLTYPKKNDFALFHPINRETSKVIEKAVISEFKNVMTFKNDRHDSPIHTAG